ncbi:MAG: O-antigen ligase domain-containing protein [Caldilinea sp. CFX5]|nr:O-antigen ligase domain-containing protein [Caldilinea sp. CFX5]
MKLLLKMGHSFLWLEPLWVALLAPSLLLRDLLWDPWVHPWLILALFLFWPFRLLLTKRLGPPTPITWPALCLLLWTPIGLVNAVQWERSWHAIGFVAFGIALLFALLNWPPTQQRPWLMAALLSLAGLALAILGPMILRRLPQEFLRFSEELARSKPADLFNAGETINANVLAGGLLLPIPLLTALALRCDLARRRWLPPLLLLPTALLLATLLLAQSRGAYVAVALSLLLVLILRWRWAGLIVLVGAIAAGTVLSLDGLGALAATVSNEGSIGSLSGRWEIWGRTLQAIADFALTGIGIGSFDLVIPHLYPYVEVRNVIPHAHNLLLQVAVDLGLPGLLFYGWLWGAVFWIFSTILWHGGALTPDVEPTSLRRRDQRKELRRQRRQAALRWALAAGGLGATVAMFFHGLIDAVTWGTKLAFLPWLLVALAGALAYQAHQPMDEPTFD